MCQLLGNILYCVEVRFQFGCTKFLDSEKNILTPSLLFFNKIPGPSSILLSKYDYKHIGDVIQLSIVLHEITMKNHRLLNFELFSQSLLYIYPWRECVLRVTDIGEMNEIFLTTVYK